ncbi:MAG: hypothetical protein PHI68_02045 [Candidatus Cloacimonetes bacterium]|nr:hypothetical protein [Candidatus Cloacimonadota bacterium]
MNLFEMVLAMFAVVFFTSISMVYNRASWNQTQRLYDASSFVQASQLCHSVLDEVDAKLFSKQLAFNNIKTTFNTTRTLNLTHVGETYTLDIEAVDCDSLGVPLTSPVVNNIYVSVSVTANTTAGLKHPVTLKRVYTKTHLNL